MNILYYKDIVTDELLQNTLDHNVHTGFLEDYRVLSCLLKIYNPQTIFEIGTNVGSGVNVMKTALPSSTVYSLDLDYDTMMENSKQYPVGANKEDRVGSEARFPYHQLRGDSLAFDYSKYPCDACYIDGEHDYDHPFQEATEMAYLKIPLIIFHDSDIPCVHEAIANAFSYHPEYQLFRVIDTRIAYAKLVSL